MTEHIDPAKTDPVCGMKVNPATAAGQTDYKGQTYYFCHPGCKQKFEASPETYLQKPQPVLVALGGKQKRGLPVLASPKADHGAATEIDPVCDMTVEPRAAAGMHEHSGRLYYFCSSHCLTKFRDHPEHFLNRGSDHVMKMGAGAASSQGRFPGMQVEYTCPMDPEIRKIGPGSCPKCGMALEPADISTLVKTRTEYTCPMHPEIVRKAPGSCPICGMALEARVVTLEEEANPELVDMTRRFWISAGLSLPLLVLAMSEMIPGWNLGAMVAPQVLVLSLPTFSGCDKNVE